MKYLLKFWDKHEIIVSEKVGQQVKIAKEKRIDGVKIGQAFYELKAISYIEPIREFLEDNLLPEKTENPVKKETLEKIKKEITKKFNW